ncbi:MAG: hypothetical protein H3Z52_15970 [archaeon]|nr:hypothetical protein [archaeon]MCP8315379.1 hypothetical protein [archaeon]MCP8322414.1 hypothetical protein [archaeon]
MSLWNDNVEREHIKKLMLLLEQLCPAWKSVGMILAERALVQIGAKQLEEGLEKMRKEKEVIERIYS